MTNEMFVFTALMVSKLPCAAKLLRILRGDEIYGRQVQARLQEDSGMPYHTTRNISIRSGARPRAHCLQRAHARWPTPHRQSRRRGLALNARPTPTARGRHAVTPSRLKPRRCVEPVHGRGLRASDAQALSQPNPFNACRESEREHRSGTLTFHLFSKPWSRHHFNAKIKAVARD